MGGGVQERKKNTHGCFRVEEMKREKTVLFPLPFPSHRSVPISFSLSLFLDLSLSFLLSFKAAWKKRPLVCNPPACLMLLLLRDLFAWSCGELFRVLRPVAHVL